MTTYPNTECEYCGRYDVPLYGWHADVWCADCILNSAGALSLPITREPESVNDGYAQPWLLPQSWPLPREDQ